MKVQHRYGVVVAVATILATAIGLPWAVAESPRPEPVDIIFDTDIGGDDVDDALALGLIHALESRGECRLLAVTLTMDMPLVAPFTDAVNTFYGRGDIPLGAVRNGSHRGGGKYLPLAEARDGDRLRYPRDVESGADVPDAVTVLRRTLAGRPDGSVVVVQVGFSTNLARLLESQPDDISTLSGPDLVKAKVRLLSIMGGDFVPRDGKQHLEYNIWGDQRAARKLAADWPTPILWSGFEVGSAILYPDASIANDFAYVPHHPLAEAYRLFMPPPHDRPTWDLTSVLAVVRPDRGYFGISEPGRVVVAEDGITRFEPQDGGRDRRLTVTPEQAARCVETFVNLCSQPPCPRQEAK